jgi:hypothetical protein
LTVLHSIIACHAPVACPGKVALRFAIQSSHVSNVSDGQKEQQESALARMHVQMLASNICRGFEL